MARQVALDHRIRVRPLDLQLTLTDVALMPVQPGSEPYQAFWPLLWGTFVQGCAPLSQLAEENGLNPFLVRVRFSRGAYVGSSCPSTAIRRRRTPVLDPVRRIMVTVI